jgi:hypothetical protein
MVENVINFRGSKAASLLKSPAGSTSSIKMGDLAGVHPISIILKTHGRVNSTYICILS